MHQATATIRKNGFTASKTWTIDLVVDGQKWTSWAHGFKTRKAAVAHCKAVGNITVNEAR